LPAATEVVARPVDSFRPERSDYRIGRQDLLEIKVFDVDELSQTVRVADDGSITMPLLGRLEVSGMTKTELEQSLARRLEAGYVRDPQVTVFVKEYESKKVAVSGAVKKPGTYEMLGQKTLLEMLSLAGGLDKDLGKEIIIFRQESDRPTQRLSVDLERLVYAADPGLNRIVEPGDIIYVPTVEKVRIFVTGAVKNPDLYEVPRDEPVTVLKAVTLAGGTTDRAAEKRVQIIRSDPDGNRVTLEVNLKSVKRGKAEDPILQKDDLVLVPESFF
jgi:polysaccharide export outer membrane protein